MSFSIVRGQTEDVYRVDLNEWVQVVEVGLERFRLAPKGKKVGDTYTCGVWENKGHYLLRRFQDFDIPVFYFLALDISPEDAHNFIANFGGNEAKEKYIPKFPREG